MGAHLHSHGDETAEDAGEVAAVVEARMLAAFRRQLKVAAAREEARHDSSVGRQRCRCGQVVGR